MQTGSTLPAINILYQRGGGSQEIDLIQEIPDPKYQPLKRTAIRYMNVNCVPPGAIELLEQFPFSLWRATNSFGDEFEVLRLKAGVELYVEIEKEVGIWEQRITAGIPEIVRAFEITGHPVRFVAVELDDSEDVASVASPTLTITSDIVEEALRNAETLIGRHGAASALDRVHTAFHGYLKAACEKAGVSVKQDAGITEIFARLREQHRALQISDPEDKARLDQIFRGMARVIDAIDPIRNRKSLAHPNPLLDEPEAALAINLIRTMLHYLDRRLR